MSCEGRTGSPRPSPGPGSSHKRRPERNHARSGAASGYLDEVGLGPATTPLPSSPPTWPTNRSWSRAGLDLTATTTYFDTSGAAGAVQPVSRRGALACAERPFGFGKPGRPAKPTFVPSGPDVGVPLLLPLHDLDDTRGHNLGRRMHVARGKLLALHGVSAGDDHDAVVLRFCKSATDL